MRRAPSLFRRHPAEYRDLFGAGLLIRQHESNVAVARTIASAIAERFRYTSDTVFDTFPWPQFSDASRQDRQGRKGKKEYPLRPLHPSREAVEKIRAVSEAASPLRAPAP